MQRALRFPAHVVEDDDDREVECVRGCGRRERRAGQADLGLCLHLHGRGVGGLPPRDGRGVDDFEARSDASLGEERVDLLAACSVRAVVDEDESAFGEPVVEVIEHRLGFVSSFRPDADQRQLLDGGIDECRCHGPLEEADAFVEEIEAGEAVAHEVQIGAEPGDTRTGQGGRVVGFGRGPESVGDPHSSVRELVAVEVGAHEDGAASAAGSALGEVAGYRLAAHHVETLLEVVEARTTHRGVGEERARGVRVGSRRAATVTLEQPIRGRVVAHRVAELRRVRRTPLDQAFGEVSHANLVLEVVLVEQRGLDRLEVPADGPVQPVLALVEDVVLEDHRPEAHVFGDASAARSDRPRSRAGPARSRARARHGVAPVDDDRQAEVDGELDHPHRSGVLGHEVVERGHHAVAWSAFDLRVVHRRVQAASGHQALCGPGASPLARTAAGTPRGCSRGRSRGRGDRRASRRRASRARAAAGRRGRPPPPAVSARGTPCTSCGRRR